MALKTQPTQDDVTAFLETVTDPQKRQDCIVVGEIMSRATGEKAMMWGTTIVGFGTYHYKYASGREGDWMLTGFSPRKQALTLYIMAGFEKYQELMDQLGTFKTGKSCLYVKRLSDINLDVLEELVRESVRYMKTQYPA